MYKQYGGSQRPTHRRINCIYSVRLTNIIDIAYIEETRNNHNSVTELVEKLT